MACSYEFIRTVLTSNVSLPYAHTISDHCNNVQKYIILLCYT
jgi:hypothetical protein